MNTDIFRFFKIVLTIFVILPANLILGQTYSTFEFQVDKADSNDSRDLLLFTHKLQLWVDASGEELSMPIDETAMISNFVMFSEDGLLMKDLNFHTVDECTAQIIKDLPQTRSGNNNMWIYVFCESQVNKSELIDVLEFLRSSKIDYVFGNEDDIIPKFVKY